MRIFHLSAADLYNPFGKHPPCLYGQIFASWIGYYFRIFFRSSSGVLMGAML